MYSSAAYTGHLASLSSSAAKEQLYVFTFKAPLLPEDYDLATFDLSENFSLISTIVSATGLRALAVAALGSLFCEFGGVAGVSQGTCEQALY